MNPPAARLLIIGLDGATWDLIRPFQEAGHLPALRRLMAGGIHGVLRSTFPPMTLPAWSTFMTGRGPGSHGLFDFTVHRPGRYAVQFVNSTFRDGPTIWGLMSGAGRRVGVVGFPATYPPEPLNGLMISGFDAPVAAGIDSSFVHPPGLYRELKRELGRYSFTELRQTRIGPGWHARALEGLQSTLRRKLAYALHLLERKGPWDCFAVLFGESDTVAHHFWLYHDPRSPRYDPRGARLLGVAILKVYQALDEAVARLVERAGGEGTTVLVLSDHGFGGAGTQVLFLNRWLASAGLLGYLPRGGGPGRALGRLRGWGMRHVPARWQVQIFRRFSGRLAAAVESASRYQVIDWAATRAYSDELNYFPSFWVNLRGREPQGTVEPGAEYDLLLAELAERLAGLRNPQSGLPIVRRAWRRDELYRGPHVERAPDLILELELDRGYSYTCLPSPPGGEGPVVAAIAPAGYRGAKGQGMNGTHRPEGILILRGEGVARGRILEGAGLEDLAPTLLYLAGLPVPGTMEGRVLAGALEAGRLAASPVFRGPVELPPGGPPRPYGPREEERLRRRLAGLGYLDGD